jgi:hypothetical protein
MLANDVMMKGILRVSLMLALAFAQPGDETHVVPGRVDYDIYL